MPYRVVRRDGRYCVVKEAPDGTTETLKCYDDESEARAYQRALYAAEGRDKGFFVKRISGRWVWSGILTNNARDRDGEIISKEAILHEAKRAPGPLWYGHLPLRIGEAQVRLVVNGHLVEAGTFDETPLAKAVAAYIHAHPEGVDDTGWAMSHGFKGKADADGVFHRIEMVERSVLPRGRAANPYTMFATGGTMDEHKKAALDELMNILSGDEVALEALRTALKAADLSKALDVQGVERKEVGEPPPPPAPPPAPETEPEPEGDDSFVEPAPRKQRRKRVATPQPLIADDLSDNLLAQLKAYIDERVNDTISEVNKGLEQAVDVMTELADRLDRMEAQEKALREMHEMPRSVLERLKSMSATNAPETKIDTSDPLASKKPAESVNLAESPLWVFGRK
jgi:flagellin-specific chaperone FliS